MRLPYYPGCTLKTDAQNFETSTLEAAKTLDIELVELPKWNCCGTVHALAKDDVMHYLAPIRNLIRVDEMIANGEIEDGKLVTQCVMCWNTIKRANTAALEDPDKMEKIRGIMEKEPEYSGKVEVLHFLELLKEKGWGTPKGEGVGHDHWSCQAAAGGPQGCPLLRLPPAEAPGVRPRRPR